MKLTLLELKNFNQLFEDPNRAGYVLNFSNKTMREFFESELSIDIYDDIFRKDGDSKLNRLRCLVKQADRETVLRVVTRLWEYRKSIPDGVTTTQDDAAYARFVTKIQGADSQAASGITPILIMPSGIDNDYFLNGLKALHYQQPHQRGHSFELWLNELFTAFYLSPKGAFRLKGEQIDGSFMLNNETYLVEAKWHNTKTGNADLHAFHGKLDQKASWARGVFISWEGFTRIGLEAWGKGKKVICVSGYDLFHMLTNNISFRMLMEEKIRRAAETGNLYVKIDEIFPNICK